MFSERIKDYRNELKLTQEEFAKVTGISRGIISQIECGSRPPSKSVLLKLSEYSKKSIDYWYGNEDKEKTWPELNSLNVLLDYMINLGLIDENGDMDDQSKEYIWKLINAEIKSKLKRTE